MVAQTGQFLVSRWLQTKKCNQGAQQHVLLVEVCLETHTCPTQAHVETSVSVEVVWSLEYVLISDGGHNIKNNQEDRTSRESSVLLSPHSSKFATASPLSVATGADLPTPFLSWPTTSDGWVTSSSAGGIFQGQYGQPLRRGHLARTLQQDFFGQFPGLFYVPQGMAPPAQAPLRRGAVGAAPEVVEVRDGCPRIVGDFRRVSVQQPVHQLVNQVDERRVLVSVKKLITNSNE